MTSWFMLLRSTLVATTSCVGKSLVSRAVGGGTAGASDGGFTEIGVVSMGERARGGGKGWDACAVEWKEMIRFSCGTHSIERINGVGALARTRPSVFLLTLGALYVALPI
jgi:hypothetical protein